MFLKHRPGNCLIDVIDDADVLDPFVKTVRARSQAGEDTVDIGFYPKTELVFPSGEPLPLCWRDKNYREHIAA